MRTPTTVLVTSLLLSSPVAAQHEGHGQHSSPYAGQEDSGIAALSAQEVQQLREGAGMGLARAAELNHYPGPKHLLEMAEELELSADQKSAIQTIYEEMHATAVGLGEQIIDREEHLQRRFAHRHIDEGSLREATSEIARLHGELRFAHLTAHLQTTALLTAAQIATYDRLRGYGQSAPATEPRP